MFKESVRGLCLGIRQQITLVDRPQSCQDRGKEALGLITVETVDILTRETLEVLDSESCWLKLESTGLMG